MLAVTTGILHRKAAKVEPQYHDPANVPASPLHFASVGPSYRNLSQAPAFQLQAGKPAAVTLPPLDFLLAVRVPLADLFLSTAVLLSRAPSTRRWLVQVRLSWIDRLLLSVRLNCIVHPLS
jgi:hypothetical protein